MSLRSLHAAVFVIRLEPPTDGLWSMTGEIILLVILLDYCGLALWCWHVAAWQWATSPRAVPLYFTHALLAVSGARCAGPGAHLTVDGLALRNAGWKWQALNPAKPMTEEQAIRRAPPPRTMPRSASPAFVVRLQLAARLLSGACEMLHALATWCTHVCMSVSVPRDGLLTTALETINLPRCRWMGRGRLHLCTHAIWT